MNACRACLADVTEAYRPEGSSRKARVGVCVRCGLVQSSFGVQRDATAPPCVSSDAGWTNVRHGKSLRTDAIWPLVSEELKFLVSGGHILDVGASRGRLVELVHRDMPNARVTGIEPHRTLMNHWPIDTKDHFSGYLEDVESRLPDASFDVIFSIHTLEHVDEPREHLSILRRLLTPQGRLVLEVPAIEHGMRSAGAEEFFIDSHASHFAARPLRALLESQGFSLLRDLRVDHAHHTWIAARRPEIKDELSVPLAEGDNFPQTEDFVAYARTLQESRASLAERVEALSKYQTENKVILVGAGRLLDALISFGGYTPSVDYIVDNYLCDVIGDVKGIPVVPLSAITSRASNYHIVLLTRTSTETLAVALSQAGARKVLHLDDL